MKAITRILLVATALLPVVPMSNARAQEKEKVQVTVADLLGKSKAGQWLRLEGVPQPDRSILCMKARIMSGDVAEDAWSIKGMVRAIDPASRQMTVGIQSVRLAASPTFKSSTGAVKSFSDVKPGMYVKVVGTFAPAGFVANKVIDEADEVVKKPGIEKKIQVQGKIERIDPSRRQVVLMGSTFVISDVTQVSSVVGD